MTHEYIIYIHMNDKIFVCIKNIKTFTTGCCTLLPCLNERSCRQIFFQDHLFDDSFLIYLFYSGVCQKKLRHWLYL